jgi:P27 family predicted phage terminase small subunit
MLQGIAGGEGVPSEPDWSLIYKGADDVTVAHEEWGVVVREMQESGTITVANGHAIRRLVEFRVQYGRASGIVARQGAIVQAKRTRVPQINPYWVIMRQADEALKVLEAELGLAPVRRGRAAKVKREKRSERASDRYLKPVTGDGP